MTPVLTGIPQRSPILPIIFLLYVKPHFNRLEKVYADTKCPRYIDDVGLVVVGKNEETNCRNLEIMAETAFEWGKENAVMIDGPKSD